MRNDRLEFGVPRVSVVLTTRDRPTFLPIALRCYAEQTYPHRELIVVDDGDTFPADLAAVETAGGTILRVKSGTILGAKLNQGLQLARGPLCHKMDDDDWYAPTFLESMVSRFLQARGKLCRSTLAGLMPYLFFDLNRWRVRRSQLSATAGSALLFASEDWKQRPFRELPQAEDSWFVQDQCDAGSSLAPVAAKETYLAVRHGPIATDRGHTWTQHYSGESLDLHMDQQPLYHRSPEQLLPAWAVTAYRAMLQPPKGRDA
jgi:hypothetical protein